MIRESLKSRGYHVGVRFGPPAVFDKQKRQDFQIKMSEGFDWRRQEFNEHAWVLASPQADGDQRSQMKLTLQPDLLNFEEFFPISTFDLFLDNLKLVLTGLVDSFSPRVLMGSGSMIRLTVNAPGSDSRLFLGNRCLNLQERLTPLHRPVHALGLRFVLPPIDTAGQPTWQGEIKIESLVEDVSQLFVEVDAKWAAPQAWSIDTVVDRAKLAHEFATDRVVSFLEQFESA